MKVWFVTGCSSGFGLSIARQALRNGDAVVATTRTPDLMQEELKNEDGEFEIVKVDLTNNGEMQAAVSSTIKRFGKLDVLVNNAGQGLLGALEECDETEIAETFSVNFLAPIRLMQAVLPIMRQQRSGHILNISAIAGFYNEMGFSIYGGSKFALEGVSEALRSEVAPLGIKVTIVEPGPFRTNFITNSLVRAAKSIDDYQKTVGKFKRVLESINGNQPGDPDKAAQAIFEVVNSSNPPLRLVLGSYAQQRFKSKLKQLGEEAEKWNSFGANTDLS
jgi:short-subunit dehydrogenase